ncbi:uncharacterized protein LOC131859541 [Cryptomeria japonica]|uniref:uncharacterized protein LOC131859541 n=1 Tax=Cryptomeria japonica TaxID=3369 RepID=UPI0027D9E369|nr:uncharacterized protein LOC131859541 [Cryptomeria japonica]
MAPFALEELKEVVFSMHPEKALGSDGFTALFFQKCWDFIGSDVLLALEESRRNRMILKELNTTLIAIIPKVDNPSSFSKFRPIALSTLYKIITKAISVRISRLLPQIVSMEQGGFAPSRETSEVLINGSPSGCFASSRGIRQGDPLSPFLFILLAEASSRAISNATTSGLWLGIKIDGLLSSQSHCLFVDDMLLFGASSLREARVIKKIISDYAAFFGQKGYAVKISNVEYSNIRGTSATEDGITLSCSQSGYCMGIAMENIDLVTGSRAQAACNTQNVQGGNSIPSRCLRNNGK